MALIYYFTFRFVIRRFDIKTPGRTEVTANANDKTDTEIATAIIGCISGIHQVGRTLGKDVFLTQQVALIGFEDMLHVNLTSPSFTYVSSASEETGRQAAGLIIGQLKEPERQIQRITLSGQLITRESA